MFFGPPCMLEVGTLEARNSSGTCHLAPGFDAVPCSQFAIRDAHSKAISQHQKTTCRAKYVFIVDVVQEEERDDGKTVCARFWDGYGRVSFVNGRPVPPPCGC